MRGAFGNNAPTQDLVLAPHQRILAAAPQVQLHFGADQAFAECGPLTAERAPVADYPDGISYYDVLLPRHEAVRAGGIWMASLLAADIARGGAASAAALVVRATLGACAGTQRAARMCLTADETRLIGPTLTVARAADVADHVRIKGTKVG